VKKKPAHERILELRAKHSPDPDSWLFSDHENAKARRAKEQYQDIIERSSPTYLFRKFGLREEKDYKTFFVKNAPKGNKYILAKERFETNLKVRWQGEVPLEDMHDMTQTREKKTPSLIVMKFWQEIFQAYCIMIKESITDSTIPKTPIRILDPKMRSERLDSLIQQHPELISDPDLFFVDSKGRKRGKVRKQIQDYPGLGSENQLAFKNYERIMKFLPFLVNGTSTINDKKKYILASDFLLGFLGVDLKPEQIKDRLR